MVEVCGRWRWSWAAHPIRALVILALLTVGGATLVDPGIAVADRSRQEPITSWTYTALGDSIAVGAGGRSGYAALFRAALQDRVGAPVQMNNLACGGCTSANLRASLESDQRFRAALAQSQVVSWNIGGNDLLAARRSLASRSCGGPDGQACLRDTVQRFEQNWDAIMLEIVSLMNGRPALAITMDVYDPFVAAESAAAPGDRRGDLNLILPYLDRISSYISTTAAANGVVLAPVRAAFNGPDGRDDPTARGLMADAIHPNDQGHRLIADLLVEVGIPRIDAILEELLVQ